MATQVAQETLQDILAMPEPERTWRLEEWVNEYDAEYGDTILIKPAKGSGLQVIVDGSKQNFPPKGQRVGRRRAITLLRKYGERGIYRNVDRATGMTPARLNSLSNEEKNKWKGYEFDFNDNYLVHVPDGTQVEEETEKNG